MCRDCPVHGLGRWVGGALVLFLCLPAWALVVHTDDQPPQRPSDAVVGRWGANASCVVIGPNLVLTTRHQGGGGGTTVEIAGQTYLVDETSDHYRADIRVARIVMPDGDPALLEEWTKVYAGRSDWKRTVVMGGYGKGRGTTLYTATGIPYAYTWSGGGNSTLRWGANYVDVPVYEIQVGLLRSKGLRADFDDVGQGRHVPYEAAPAAYDSGGGWFVQEDGWWQVAGLSAIVEHQNETWFRNAGTGNPDPDHLYAVRVGSYADWIAGSVAPPMPGDATADGIVNGDDYTVWCDHQNETGLPAFSEGGWVFANFNEDDVINGGDYTIWADHYDPMCPSGGPAIPEPATAALLALGAVPLVRRRRRRKAQ